MAGGGIEAKIKISAQFFSRAYLKYNMAADRGSGRAVNLRSLRWRRLARHDVDRSGEHSLDLARLKHEQVDAIMPQLHAA
jgi:hypothetical protein